MKILKEAKLTLHVSLNRLSLKNFGVSVLVDKFGYTLDTSKGYTAFKKGLSEISLTNKVLYVRNALGTAHIAYDLSQEIDFLEYSGYIEVSNNNPKNGFLMRLEK